MRWPGSSNEDDGKKGRVTSWTEHLDPVNWSWAQLAEPGVLLPSIVFTVTTLSALRIYKTYLRRIPSVNHIKPGWFRRKGLFGQVTSVGDADNFRIFHTPGGRLWGWGWWPGKKVPTTREGLANNTVSPIKLDPLSVVTFFRPPKRLHKLTDTCSNRRSRCARTSTLGPRSTAVFERGS
jgi:hypothetical protein